MMGEYTLSIRQEVQIEMAILARIKSLETIVQNLRPHTGDAQGSGLLVGFTQELETAKQVRDMFAIGAPTRAKIEADIAASRKQYALDVSEGKA